MLQNSSGSEAAAGQKGRQVAALCPGETGQAQVATSALLDLANRCRRSRISPFQTPASGSSPAPAIRHKHQTGLLELQLQGPGVRLIDVGSFPQNFGAQTSDTPAVKAGGTPIRFTSLAGQPISCPLVARIRSLDCRISSILALTSFSSEKSYAIH